jgi:protein disulfide-isomerase A6
MQKNVAFFLIASLLGALPVKADGLYTKNSPVLQVDSKTYDRLIAKSNHTSVRILYHNSIVHSTPANQTR